MIVQKSLLLVTKPIFHLLAVLQLLSLSVMSQEGEPVNEYVLSEMDAISVQVFGEPELTSFQRVDGNGQVRMGLIGTIRVSGMTLRQAELAIEKKYTEERYLRDPQVSIQVDEYATKYFVIFGEVGNPGQIALEDEATRMSLVDAISKAGGFTGIAKSDAVRITRTTSDGEERTVVVDVDDLINGNGRKIPTEFRYLLPGDVVNVPERLF